MSSPKDEISLDILEEGCYHLSKLGMSSGKIALALETSPGRVGKFVSSYASKLKSGEAREGDFDRQFWEGVMKEAEGDMKLTVVSDKGFHHVWKSELQQLDGRALMAIYESSRDFLGANPNEKFLDYPPPKGHDPLALDRAVQRAVGVLGELIDAKWKATKPRTR